SRLLGEIGQPTRARKVARSAAAEARACGVDDLVERVANEANSGERALEGADVAAGLSDAELRVATLAALGHTNREIAHKLFVTVSTVEQHLTKVYRKLGVSKRSDLPAGLATVTGTGG
ncbi:MAG: helix-turn-helix transcriptional regulator, partial [Actinomycetota bacterium]|nr:helix-turn-helix transcriptional regulator [Actinomycetota bacterium]